MRALSGELFYKKELVGCVLLPLLCLCSHSPCGADTPDQRITYSRQPSNSTLARTNPEASREAAAVRAAKLTVSNAQGEYEQLEKDREAEEAKLGKRELDGGEEERPGKRQKEDNGGEEEEMEIEMDMDDDDDDEGECLYHILGYKGWNEGHPCSSEVDYRRLNKRSGRMCRSGWRADASRCLYSSEMEEPSGTVSVSEEKGPDGDTDHMADSNVDTRGRQLVTLSALYPSSPPSSEV